MLNYLFCIFSFILGSLFTLVIIFKNRSGIISIQEIDGKDNWTFILEKPIEKVEKSKYAVLKIKNDSR